MCHSPPLVTQKRVRCSGGRRRYRRTHNAALLAKRGYKVLVLEQQSQRAATALMERASFASAPASRGSRAVESGPVDGCSGHRHLSDGVLPRTASLHMQGECHRHRRRDAVPVSGLGDVSRRCETVLGSLFRKRRGILPVHEYSRQSTARCLPLVVRLMARQGRCPLPRTYNGCTMVGQDSAAETG
jgi:hypothetical protein